MLIDFSKYADTNNSLPWRWYHPDGEPIEFPQRKLGFIKITKIPGLSEPGDYVLASRIGQHIDNNTGFDWNNRGLELRANALLEKMGCDNINATANAIRGRDHTNRFCQYCLRTRFEYAYLNDWKDLWVLAGLRRHEKLLGAEVDSYHVHHVLPKAEFPKLRERIENLILLPTIIHKELHVLYGMIADREHPISPIRAVSYWMANSEINHNIKQYWKADVQTCAICYAEALAACERKGRVQ